MQYLPCGRWPRILTAVSVNSSTNTCTPKQMGETGSFPPQIRVLTCGPYEVILHRPRQWETFKTQLQRETMAQKRKTSSWGSQYVFSSSFCPEFHLNQYLKWGESTVPIPYTLITAIQIITVMHKRNLPLLLTALEWADGETLIVLSEFPPFYGSLKSWVKSIVLFGYQKGKEVFILLVYEEPSSQHSVLDLFWSHD